MQLILATHNKHKIKEIGDVIKHPQIEVKSLLDYEVELPPETGATFIENAVVKARTVYKFLLTYQRTPPLLPRRAGIEPSHQWILADDSGLIVDALDGRPGVYSSRYSGEPVDYARNNKKLLGELAGVPKEKRTAHFICSMILIDPNGKEYEIEGRVSGRIADKESGAGGFGYDPIFYLPDRNCTIAELPLSEKSKISHRGLAAKKALEIMVKTVNGSL
ncbi:MAG: non-canonical purine NTP pyrophosphatase [Deltaproteobacteria bacterium]|nr:non-canonical purine NTP pyrophosphatase [Deltaproteobacteria bacterium]